MSLQTITELPLAARFNLRVGAGNQAAAAAALGCELPAEVGAVSSKAKLRIICLGPDEWQLDVPESESHVIKSAFAAVSAEAPHSLVDVTDREVTFRLEGPRAKDVLTIGCPRDLRDMAPGSGARTVFDTVQAVLIREAEERFTLSVWRSFAPHVRELLSIADAELATGL